MHRHVLQPNGQPLFLFPPARMRTQRNRYTHSRGPNVDERCCCQCADEHTQKHSILIKILWPLYQQRRVGAVLVLPEITQKKANYCLILILPLKESSDKYQEESEYVCESFSKMIFTFRRVLPHNICTA